MTDFKPTSPANKLLCALLRNRHSRPLTQKFGGLFLRYFPGQITCRQFETTMIDFNESRLTKAQKLRFERHMRLCPMCRTSFAGYLKAIELGKKVHPDYKKGAKPLDPPRDLVDAILASPNNPAPHPNNS